MVDYIVVGLGLAGTSFCETLRKNNKEYVVYNDDSQTSSLVAGGISNPVILKRFTLAWHAKELLPIANSFYAKFEKEFSVKLNSELPVLRRLNSIEEQNSWFQATDKPSLKRFLATTLVHNKNLNIDAPFDFGEVLCTTKLDTRLLIETYKKYLLTNHQLVTESFEHGKVVINNDYVEYKELKARKIVFAEGYGLKFNSYFNYLPLQGSKGEYLIIKSSALKEINAVKSSIFIIPLGDDLYKIGANYERWDKTNLPTNEAKMELLNKLDATIKCSYEVVGHEAGIRPTISDRRPLLGKHPEHDKFAILNGFGSHGVMIAPWASEHLYHYLENGKHLNQEVDIERFKSKSNL
ncbi:NAD(P)/FAD-dependent oxidoreductase [Maribacter sp. CXY002]|uniref:NAD(P)/FAD-dependent oxidoreductase n=1 Tax=Maribacter luteocoastalis TaxID=3407671 RepID=UPI003B67E403